MLVVPPTPLERYTDLLRRMVAVHAGDEPGARVTLCTTAAEAGEHPDHPEALWSYKLYADDPERFKRGVMRQLCDGQHVVITDWPATRRDPITDPEDWVHTDSPTTAA